MFSNWNMDVVCVNSNQVDMGGTNRRSDGYAKQTPNACEAVPEVRP